MMEMIEAGEEISPTAFSLSVHNAIAGLFSMARRNNTQSTVVAPGEEGMAPAFIEALGGNGIHLRDFILDYIRFSKS